MTLPNHPISLMHQVYRHVLPLVHEELAYWKQRATQIPNEELRRQALASIETKTFHCEGGSILALAAQQQRREAIRFIVAYQTISDYLDNLCDRSTSLDAQDFAALHEAMKDAITVGATPRLYYRYREDQDDGGYLTELMQTCQSICVKMKHYSIIQPMLRELNQYYCDLQIHKHVQQDEREDRLRNWYESHQEVVPEMSWYEFSACAGSTLGIFCLISYAMRNDFEEGHAVIIRDGYFPYLQGLHILLDYFIDQEEDRLGGDLNFCFYFENEDELFERLIDFIQHADQHTIQLPDRSFHQFILRGLLGIYLSDSKVSKQKAIKKRVSQLLKQGGHTSYFFYWNGKAYRRLRNWRQGRRSI